MKRLSVIIALLSQLALPMTAHAQSNVFDSLDAIQQGLSQRDIEVIDYSNNLQGWGGLPTDVIAILENAGYQNLQEFSDDLPDAEEAPPVQAIGMVFLEALSELDEEDFPEPLQYLSESERSIFLLAVAAASSEENALEKLASELTLDGQTALTFANALLYVRDSIAVLVTEIIFTGEAQINQVLTAIAKTMRNVLGGLAVIWMIISGIQMVMAGGDENKITEQKQSITYAVIGLAIVIVAERIISVVYGAPGVVQDLTIAGSRFSAEVLGIVGFLKAFVAAIAMFMIIISGMKTIFAAGDENQITEQRKSVLWVVVGIVIIVINQVIVENLYIIPSTREILDSLNDIPLQDQVSITAQNVNTIIVTIGTVASYLLGFTGLIALGALIYGAGMMVANYGNEDMVNKSKTIVKNAIIGIMIIISSFALINTLIL